MDAEQVKEALLAFELECYAIRNAGAIKAKRIGLHAAIDAMQAEIDRAKQSEKEGWRYSDELEQERKRQKAEIDRLRKDAERYQWLRSQHEIDDAQSSNNNYGKSYPPRTMTVFADDGEDGLEPLPCDPGSLDAAIDAALSEETKGR